MVSKLLKSLFGLDRKPSGIGEQNEDIFIFVIGPTGAGKSNFINVATRKEEAKVGHTLSDGTTAVQGVRCPYSDHGRNRYVVFVDTPGLEPDNGAVFEKKIELWWKLHAKGRIAAGILYIHPITNRKMTNPPTSNLLGLDSLCGGQICKKIVLVTTMWSSNVAAEEKREEAIRTNYWKKMLDGGSGMVRFENTTESAWHVVNSLLQRR